MDREGNAIIQHLERAFRAKWIILTMPTTTRPAGVTLLTLFFVFGVLMASLAAGMLLFPGSILEPLWRLNPRARDAFVAIRFWAVIVMVIIATACAVAALGLWRCRRWGYVTAAGILCVNLLGDTANTFIAHDWRTIISLPIGGAMITYLVRNRRVFGQNRE